MKKTWIAVIALVMVLALACTACGGSKEEPAAAATSAPAATDIPSVTAPPAAGANTGVETGLAADANAAPDKRESNRDEWLASLSEQQRLVEETLVGKTVEDLYAAIGQPKNATYSASCMVADGQDGILEYDGFTVSTTRATGGPEYVMGTEN